MERKTITINTDKAPAAIGPYSQAKIFGDTLFTSGQIPINPAKGNVDTDDITGQTEQVLKNIQAILTAAGATFEDVFKTTCFLSDMNNFATFNEIYEKAFTSNPARSCVVVKELPKGVLVEVEAIAKVPESNKGYSFDEIFGRSKLSTSKWEYEKNRTKNPDILCFGTADMDFKSAPAILDALSTVVENGHFGYPFKRESYYTAVIDYFKRHFDWEFKKEEIANSVAIYPSFQGIIEGLTNEGDEIIYNTPVHHIFQEIITATGRTPVVNPLKIVEGDYQLDFEDMKNKISEKTSLYILCNPHNPMGRIWNKGELNQLMDICIKNNVVVLADEVYFGLLYPGEKFTPIASLSEEAAMNTITCISPSKSFNLTGVKHSLVISKNPDLLNAYRNELKKNNEYYGESIFGHAATEAAFTGCDEWSRDLMEYVKGNYETIAKFMKVNIPSAVVYKPQSTYFCWIDFNYLNLSNQELVELFEKDAELIVSHGYFLGMGGDGFIRWNLGCPRSVLEKGLERIAKAINK